MSNNFKNPWGDATADPLADMEIIPSLAQKRLTRYAFPKVISCSTPTGSDSMFDRLTEEQRTPHLGVSIEYDMKILNDFREYCLKDELSYDVSPYLQNLIDELDNDDDSYKVVITKGCTPGRTESINVGTIGHCDYGKSIPQSMRDESTQMILIGASMGGCLSMEMKERRYMIKAYDNVLDAKSYAHKDDKQSWQGRSKKQKQRRKL